MTLMTLRPGNRYGFDMDSIWIGSIWIRGALWIKGVASSGIDRGARALFGQVSGAPSSADRAVGVHLNVESRA